MVILLKRSQSVVLELRLKTRACFEGRTGGLGLTC
jgi:hypothetical protein